MKIAHVGPPRARLGGPAGYLTELAAAWAELAAAWAEAPSPGVEVTFPPPSPPRTAPAVPPAARRSPWRERLGELRRRVAGPPAQFRHPRVDLERPGGPAAEQIEEARKATLAEVEPSLAAALEAGADVLFSHDPWTAAEALARRAPGQEVWLLVHTPMPLGFYVAWCWGSPEVPWEQVAAWPDVLAETTREVETWRRVDRLLIPCAEAGDELVRFDPRFAAPLTRAEFLPSGAAGPARQFPGDERATLRQRFGLPAGAPVALYLGNAQPYRGLDVLLEALAHLTPGPGVLALAGPAPETLPRHQRLLPLGRVAAVADLLRAVDFVVNVNRFSLFDLSTLEALEAGCPLLLHATGGNRTFADLGAGCQVIRELSPAAVAAGLDTLFRAPADELAALGAASRRCWEQHLTPGHLAARHETLYRRAGEERR